MPNVISTELEVIQKNAPKFDKIDIAKIWLTISPEM
jgi:hypothetical protein